VAAPAWPGPPPSSVPVAWRPLARPLTDRRSRRRPHSDRARCAAHVPAWPAPTASPQPHGRDTAPPSQARTGRCPPRRRAPRASWPGSARAAPSSGVSCASPRGRGPARCRFRCRRPRLALAPHRRSRGSLRGRRAHSRAQCRPAAPPASDRLRGALEPLELAHRGPQLADSGVELRADAIERIRHQRGPQLKRERPAARCGDPVGHRCSGRRARHDSLTTPPALGRSREVRAGNRETRNRKRLDHGHEPQAQASNLRPLAAIQVVATTHSASTRRLRQSTTPGKRARPSRSRYPPLPRLSCA
jgi:hypothetical protein